MGRYEEIRGRMMRVKVIWRWIWMIEGYVVGDKNDMRTLPDELQGWSCWNDCISRQEASHVITC